jgi:predicted nucleotide-binding protein (sugar kinase/HSP70/actin superfamily)
MKITFPHMGDSAIAFKTFFEHFGYEVVVPPPTSRATLERGLRVSPATMCFPFKASVGDLMAALDLGAEAVAMFDMHGHCRFSYYNMLYREILPAHGYDVPFIVFTPWDGIRIFLRNDGIPLRRKILGARLSCRKLAAIEAIDAHARRYRPRERERGSAGRLRAALMREVDACNDVGELTRLPDGLAARFAGIETYSERDPLRVGLVGEIYTLFEPGLNQHIDVLLGTLGAEVHTSLGVTSVIKHWWPQERRRVRRLARGYLRSGVGGHGDYTVAHTVQYARWNYDGVIHIAPFGCMPETTVRPLLAQIGRDTGMPVLSLTLDEHTNRQGLQTRLEAFIDLLRMRCELRGTGRATAPRQT